MTDVEKAVAALDWDAIREAFDRDGYAVLPPLLSADERAAIIALDEADVFRTRVEMKRHRYGEGRYGYFRDPLPPVVQALREALYPRLAPIANAMMATMRQETRYPADLEAFLKRCAAGGQTKPTPLLLRYAAGGHNRLHQDLYGPLAFPIQAAMLLSDPAEDFTGGEFLIAETAPRQQTRAEAVTLGAGETILFPTAERPVPGARGPMRARMRHGVSRVRSGARATLGVIFHNAA
jgi:hypothetical protein